jgi:hypothetical protein
VIEPDTLELNDRPPALREALWTALAVFVCTALLAIGLAANIEPVLLRFLAAVLFAGGFTALTVALNRTSVGVLFGDRPRPVSILLALLVGAAVWLPVSWAIIVTDGALGLAFGTLSPPSALGSGISPAALVIQFGIVVPACLGLLFFVYVQRAAEGIGARGWPQDSLPCTTPWSPASSARAHCLPIWCWAWRQRFADVSPGRPGMPSRR